MLVGGPSVCVSASHGECLQSGLQSLRWGAQMYVQAPVLCSLNSVNPSAVPKLRTQASPVFSPLSRIFTLFSPSKQPQDRFHFFFSSALVSFVSVHLGVHFNRPELFLQRLYGRFQNNCRIYIHLLFAQFVSVVVFVIRKQSVFLLLYKESLIDPDVAEFLIIHRINRLNLNLPPL